MAKKRYYESSADYAGMKARRMQEREDGSMISEDHSAVANLPQNVMMKPYPMTPYNGYNLDDTIKGIDVQMTDDDKRKKTGKYPEKY